MDNKSVPDIAVYICRNSIPGGKHLPSQWSEKGIRFRLKELPCSGKTDAQYLFHALESGARGVCVITCPHGECTLAQGNYRAEIRIRTVQRLLEEIGAKPGCAEIMQSSKDDTLEQLKEKISRAALRIAGLEQAS